MVYFGNGEVDCFPVDYSTRRDGEEQLPCILYNEILVCPIRQVIDDSLVLTYDEANQLRRIDGGDIVVGFKFHARHAEDSLGRGGILAA